MKPYDQLKMAINLLELAFNEVDPNSKEGKYIGQAVIEITEARLNLKDK